MRDIQAQCAVVREAFWRPWDTHGLQGGTRSVHGPGHGMGTPTGHLRGWEKNAPLVTLLPLKLSQGVGASPCLVRGLVECGERLHTRRVRSFPGGPAADNQQQRAGPGLWGRLLRGAERGWGSRPPGSPGRRFVCQSWKCKRSYPNKRWLLGAGPQVGEAGLQGSRPRPTGQQEAPRGGGMYERAAFGPVRASRGTSFSGFRGICSCYFSKLNQASRCLAHLHNEEAVASGAGSWEP